MRAKGPALVLHLGPNFFTPSYGRAYVLPALRAWLSVRTERDIQNWDKIEEGQRPGR